MTVVAAERVSRRYGERVALQPSSFTIARGEAVALVGPSGAGKSTLLGLLAGMIVPSEGVVRLMGTPAHELGTGGVRAERVGLLTQRLDLIPNLAVLHNVLAGNLGRWGLGRSLASLLSPRDTGPALAALERVGLGGREHERTSRLSGGEQQRVALARLLVQQPHLMLVDEPVSSLDPARAEALVRLLVDLAADGGHTLVASLHGVDLATAHFQRIVGLRAGRVMFDRASGEVSSADLRELYAFGEGSGRPI